MSTRSEEKKRSLFSMICCACRSTKKPARVQTQACNTNEPCDYMVEKLAIKNLPLTTFGTADDLMRYNRMNTPTKNAPFMKCPMTPTSSLITPAREIVNVNLMQPTKPPLASMPQQVPSISSHNSVVKHEELNCPFHMQYPPKTVLVKDKEAQLVTNILNKHASLYTLDEKNPVPKDPLNPPRNTVVIPSSVQEANARDTIFPSKNNNAVQVKVQNQAVSSPFKYPSRPPSAKKDMSPEIKETINALRLVQKPHFPGVQPKNQKSILPSITPRLTEREITSRLLVDTVSENDGPFKIETQTVATMPVTTVNKSTCLTKQPKIVKDNQEEELLANIYLQRKSSPIGNKSSDSNLLKSSGHEKNEKISSDELGKSRMLKSTSLESLETTQKHVDSSAVNQFKCQNLKWKIIIKHHADKNRGSSEPKQLDQKDLQYNIRQCLLDNSLNFPG